MAVDWNVLGPRLLAALKGVAQHPDIALGDCIYDVREREGEGWEGPRVKAWGEAVHEAEAAIKAAEDAGAKPAEGG